MKSFKVIEVTGALIFVVSLIFTSCVNNKEKSLELVDNGVEMYYKANYKEAYKYFKEASEVDKDNFEAWFWLGNYYNNKREYKKAIEYFTKCIKLNPGFADAYANRGIAKNYLDDKTGACEDWKKAKSLGKNNLDNYLEWCE